jgi:hypothetical protein
MKKSTTRRRLHVATALVALTAMASLATSVHAGSVPTWDTEVGGSGRFKVLGAFGGQAVLDKETGLVWEKALSPLAVPFSGAVFACATLEIGKRRGWRLPTGEELASLMDLSQTNPPIAAANPFENLAADPDTFYWTATPSPILANAKLAWSFAGTGSVADAPLTLPVRRWCVRGGQNTVE